MEILFENKPIITKAIYSEFHKIVSPSKSKGKFIIMLLGSIIIFGIGVVLLFTSAENILWIIFCFVFAMICPCIYILLLKLSVIAYFNQYISLCGGNSESSVEITKDYITKKDKFSSYTYDFSKISQVHETDNVLIIVVGNDKSIYQKNILLEKNSFIRGSFDDFKIFLFEKINQIN